LIIVGNAVASIPVYFKIQTAASNLTTHPENLQTLKTVFLPFKKKRDFFCFSPRTKGSKAGLRGNFQIASFPYGNAENMFYNFVVLFF
jgi:hypothetical protein